MKSPDTNARNTGAVTRRSFIQTTGQTAALAVLGGGAALATVDKGLAVPSGKRIRVGIIGCGSVSWKYIPPLQSKPYIELAKKLRQI